MLESFEYSEYNPEEIEDRLDLIKKIKKKYGDSFEEIVTFLDNAIKEKDKLENFSILFEELLTKEKALKENLYSKYQELREIRLQTAKTLSNNVVVELKELGMKDAKFDVEFSNIPSFEECKFDCVGFDCIQFLFSANLGEPLRPLSTVISGGEMSRFMLALKVQTSKCNEISTFVFDEIDAGISGIVANTVGEKLCKISKNVQVICISHLPQICAMSDVSFLIYKQEVDGRTKSFVQKLNEGGEQEAYDQPVFLRIAMAAGTANHALSSNPEDWNKYGSYIIDYVHIYQHQGDKLYTKKLNDSNWNTFIVD
jgi:DNA repair protein RecN (Recombination protein N)